VKTEWNMDVDLATLETALAKVMAHLRAQGLKSVRISDDYYWDIDEPAERYNVLKDLERKKITIGQLSHDWERMQQIAADDKHTVGYALVWAAALLRAIGERNVG